MHIRHLLIFAVTVALALPPLQVSAAEGIAMEALSPEEAAAMEQDAKIKQAVQEALAEQQAKDETIVSKEEVQALCRSRSHGSASRYSTCLRRKHEEIGQTKTPQMKARYDRANKKAEQRPKRR